MIRPPASEPLRQIMFIVNGSEAYGVQRMTVSTIRALLKLNVDISVVSLVEGEMLDRCAKVGANVLTLNVGPPPNYRPSLMANLRSAFALKAYSRKAAGPLAEVIRNAGSPPTVVRMPNLVPLVAKAAYAAGARSFWITPNIISSRYPLAANKLIYEYLFSRFRLIPIANSLYTRSTFLNWFSDARVLHLGIDSDEFDPDTAHTSPDRSSFGLSSDDILIGLFARLVREKGQDRMIRAIAALGRDHENVKLLIAGSGDASYEQELKELAEQIGLQQRVIFTGPIQDLRPFYAMCDIIANCRVDPEPFGLSVIEAMMMARPILAHCLGGPGETILDGETGWLTPNPSVEAFTQGLQRSLADRPRWIEMGAAGRAHAIRNFESSRVASNLLSIIFEAQPAIRGWKTT